MSDFRVPLPSSDDYEHELDWVEAEKRWVLSFREIGFGKSWVQNQTPSYSDLNELETFFRIPPDHLQEAALTRLSPGELALIHSNMTDITTVYAVLCKDCGLHWYVFRWESDKAKWGIYGRNCDFTWRRGQEPQRGELELLMKVRGLSTDPLLPPKG